MHLHLVGGQTEQVHFPKLETFQGSTRAYADGQPASSTSPSVIEGEYLVVRPEAVIGVRVEPQFSSVDDA